MTIKIVIYQAEEGGYWAKVPAIPGCVSQGETLEEVRENILEALQGCLEVAHESAESENGTIVEELKGEVCLR
jgi:predicted RNase H-like HicB family nuclease